MLDDGRLTDGKGRVVSFKNTVIIMTSNLGSEWIAEESSRDEDEIKAKIEEALRRHFRPEFFNRIDDVIVFHRLTRDEIEKIVEIQLESPGEDRARPRHPADVDAGGAAASSPGAATTRRSARGR